MVSHLPPEYPSEWQQNPTKTHQIILRIKAGLFPYAAAQGSRCCLFVDIFSTPKFMDIGWYRIWYLPFLAQFEARSALSNEEFLEKDLQVNT